MHRKVSSCYPEGRLPATSPREFTLELTPRARVDVIDVRGVMSAHHGDVLNDYPRALCCYTICVRITRRRQRENARLPVRHGH